MSLHDHIAPHGLLSRADHHLAHAAAAVRVQRMAIGGFSDESVAGGIVEQTSSIDALLHGAYEGDVTFAELARHGDLGIGTVQHLDGEMLAVDGEFLQIRSDGSVHHIDPDTATPFAVVCRFRAETRRSLSGPLDWQQLQAELDTMSDDTRIQAVRIDAELHRVSLRSVPRQVPPYPPLSEVVAHQRTWEAHDVRGTIVGFRFPAELQGIEVAGLHLHFVAADRSVGGHVTDLELTSGDLQLQQLDELHVEVPDGVYVGDADDADELGAAIRAVEG